MNDAGLWVPDVAAPLPQHIFNAERMMLTGTPALTAWVNEHAERHGLVIVPFGEAGPFVRRFRMAGHDAAFYQLGGQAVFVDPGENRLFVATLSAPKKTALDAVRSGWTVVNGVRYGKPVQNGARMAQRKREAALLLVARYGHLLGDSAWVQVPYDNGMTEIRVKDLRRPAPAKAPPSVKVSGQVYNHARNKWVNSRPKLSPAPNDRVVVAPTTVLDVRHGHEWVSLHDRQTGEALYRFTPEQWADYVRRFGND